MIPHWKDGLTNEQYHKDKDFVSSTGLKLLISSTPDVFYDQIICGNKKPSTDAMNLSSLVHVGNLEPKEFMARYAVKPKFDMRKTADKLECERWERAHAGKIIVTKDELEVIQGTYESIRKHKDARLLLSSASFERSGYYLDPVSQIPCRIRYDAYDSSSSVLIDIKAVRDASSDAFRRAIFDYRWDLSMAMYGQGIMAIEQKRVEQYVLIAVEKTSPYRCAVYELSERSLEIGREDYFRALSILKECRANGFYPSLQSSYEEIDLPTWFMEKRESERKTRDASGNVWF